MSSKSVKKFLNSTIISLIVSNAITKTQATYLSYNLLRKFGWYKGYDGITNLETKIVLNRKDGKDIQTKCLNMTIADWLETENFSEFYRKISGNSSQPKYITENTDAVGKFFLENGFGYLCWWRIEKPKRKDIFKKAVQDMGKEFVLSLPVESLPINRNEEDKILFGFNDLENYDDYIRGKITIRDLVNSNYNYGTTVEYSLRILQEAGFTKKDGAIFDLDLSVESEADKLRAKYPKLNQRTAKLFLEVAKVEGWVK